MMDPLAAIAMFSGPTSIVSVFVVSDADALSPLLHALTTVSAERLSRTAALVFKIVRSRFIYGLV
jgi:hypothetical protein